MDSKKIKRKKHQANLKMICWDESTVGESFVVEMEVSECLVSLFRFRNQFNVPFMTKFLIYYIIQISFPLQSPYTPHAIINQSIGAYGTVCPRILPPLLILWNVIHSQNLSLRLIQRSRPGRFSGCVISSGRLGCTAIVNIDKKVLGA